MKVNIGDKVVCIKNDEYGCTTVGKIYEVLGTSMEEGLLYFVLFDNARTYGYYLAANFMSLGEWREQQINKIL